MKWIRLIKTIYVLFGCGYLYAQNGAVSGFCVKGATPAITSGSSSTNTLQGIVPGGPAGCLVQVYLTGTVTPATIYPNVGGGTLNNPFRASLSGQWLFYASTTQSYDVVLSGGVPPNVYTSPVTLTGIPAGGGSGDPNAVTIATPFTVADSIAISAGAGRGIVSTNLSYDIGSNNLFNSTGVFNITDTIIHGSVLDGSTISNSSIGDSSPAHGTFTNLILIGNEGAAGPTLNEPSAVAVFQSFQWNGSVVVPINWEIQSIPTPSSGIGTLDTLTFSHGGASSSYNVSIPNLNVTGGLTSTSDSSVWTYLGTDTTAVSSGIRGGLLLGPNLGVGGSIGWNSGIVEADGGYGGVVFIDGGSSSLNSMFLGIRNLSTQPSGICVNGLGQVSMGTGSVSNVTCPISGSAILSVGGNIAASNYLDASLISAPFVASDSNGKLTAGTGFTGTKTAGSCVITIVSGIITNVTGC